MGQSHEIEKVTLNDDNGAYDVTVIAPSRFERTVLFAVGGGGDPQRHLPLLRHLATHGFTVIAPHFERMMSSMPTEDELKQRAFRLSRTLDITARPGSAVGGVGHSIGAAMLLALAGARLWMGPGHAVDIAPDARIGRAALFAPATGFFRAPGALDAVRIPIFARAGTKDGITPPFHVEMLRDELEERVPTDIRIVENAGHFSFMNEPPPHSEEPLSHREAFLANLADEVCDFLCQ